VGAKPGHPTNLSVDEEEKLVTFACNRAALGLGEAGNGGRECTRDIRE